MLCSKIILVFNKINKMQFKFIVWLQIIYFFYLKSLYDYFCQMAQYYLNSHNSMSSHQKENITSLNRPKLAINIITPNNENKLSEKLAFSQALHQEYQLASSTSNSKREKKVDNSIGQGRMKLRDYLFLAKTSASKNANEKKKVLQNLQENCINNELQLKELKKSKSELRKQKYGIKNSEMFKILKQQMDRQIQESLQEINDLKNSLNKQLMQHTIPSNSQMVMMYNLRSLIKDKLRKSIEEMKQHISSQAKSSQEQRYQIMFDIDEEFKGDFKLTADAFAKKYIQMTRSRTGSNENYGL